MVGAASALTGLIIAAFAPVSAAEALHAASACRGGVPNGAYELRMADGRLRVAGAFAYGRKTGTFIFWSASGARSAVVPYEDDAKTGTVALWYTAASRELGHKLEAPFSENRLHGIQRSWHPNGTERTELRYEYGTLLSAQAWDARGVALSEAQAWRLAARDAEANERVYAGLEAIVRDHLPRCE